MNAFIVSDNITSPLGLTTKGNFDKMASGISSVKLVTDRNICKVPAYLSVFEDHFDNKFETICEMSIRETLSGTDISPADPKTLFILSTTKGNIGIPLNITAENIASKFGFINKPLVISNACISGLLAITIGERMIKNGQYDHVVVTGADILTDFIVSGFQSLKAIGDSNCRPFDSTRNGINLGECAATVILTSDISKCSGTSVVECLNGAFNSDANHISGPSRTAEGLHLSILRTLNNSKSLPSFINAHGTATVFNDEMESIAFDRSELNNVPVNSLKGFIGHTLGAAGIAECIISSESLKNNIILKTLGFDTPGVSKNINVTKKNLSFDIKSCLKTASGFGGCNASILLVKSNAAQNN
ncbi:MAG TPA: beta-ketoacyl synthase N-terminal-like domain-containing protein [bacterium]|nr:beta-ketoacyl synthase N-terminal-like domain-containing protein [bacterium]HPS28994.1 beta-ketoacyl synthase N-terminal-like domain-containing protein [bacterium]